MMSPMDGLGGMDPSFYLMEKDLQDFEKSQPRKSLFDRMLELHQDETKERGGTGDVSAGRESNLLKKVTMVVINTLIITEFTSFSSHFC